MATPNLTGGPIRVDQGFGDEIEGDQRRISTTLLAVAAPEGRLSWLCAHTAGIQKAPTRSNARRRRAWMSTCPARTRKEAEYVHARATRKTRVATRPSPLRNDGGSNICLNTERRLQCMGRFIETWRRGSWLSRARVLRRLLPGGFLDAYKARLRPAPSKRAAVHGIAADCTSGQALWCWGQMGHRSASGRRPPPPSLVHVASGQGPRRRTTVGRAKRSWASQTRAPHSHRLRLLRSWLIRD